MSILEGFLIVVFGIILVCTMILITVLGLFSILMGFFSTYSVIRYLATRNEEALYGDTFFDTAWTIVASFVTAAVCLMMIYDIIGRDLINVLMHR